MAAPRIDVLIVDDSPSIIVLMQATLRKRRLRVEGVGTGAEALEAMRSMLPSVALIDLGLPDMDGMELLRAIRSEGLPVLPIVITGRGSISVAVEAMQAGARDFLVKPINAERLSVTVLNMLETHRLREQVDQLREDVGLRRFEGFIGSSPAMQTVYRVIRNVASSKATVFIQGESGTGKEVAADAIHRQSNRASGPCVPLNCGAIPRTLIESELFGHVRGAFTGATADREGAASQADGGTLFLDEICDMPLDMQVKLLRFVQTGTFQKVGGSRVVRVDVRFVCATNKDPIEEVREGRFREDLFYRLHVVPLHLPALREREGDILEIARHFLSIYSREEGKSFEAFSQASEDVLSNYQWPGNVRQLQNVIRNVVVLNDGPVVTPEMLPSTLLLETQLPAQAELSEEPRAFTQLRDAGSIEPLWIQEKQLIERAVSLCNGSVQEAARRLEISPSTIYRKKIAWRDAGLETTF